VRRLRRAVSSASKDRKNTLIDKPPTLRPFDDYNVQAASFNNVSGWLDTCEYFLVKSARDLPLVARKPRGKSTPVQRALIRWELVQIEDAADMLLKLCEA